MLTSINSSVLSRSYGPLCCLHGACGDGRSASSWGFGHHPILEVIEDVLGKTLAAGSHKKRPGLGIDLACRRLEGC